MIIEFSVGNFRSFRDIVTLSMVAAKLRAKNKALDENNVFAAPGAPPLLTSAAIYGANASGKSNLIAAIGFMRRFVIDSTKETRATGAIDVESFRLSTTTIGQPSHFEIVFVLDDKRYRYGFEVTSERVVEEWLFYVPSTREARLFERFEDEIKLGESFKEGRDLIEKTRPNALFLSVVAQFNGPIAKNVIDWFRGLGIISGLSDQGIMGYTMRRWSEGKATDKMRQFIQQLDLGIQDLSVEKGLASLEPIPEDMPDEFRKIIEPFREFFSREDVERLTVITEHPVFDQEGIRVRSEKFDLGQHESEGTQKLFAFSGPLFDTLEKGKVLFVDELDARLHPLLTREIVRLFNSRQTNPHHAQLIFTTQDTSLLDNRFLRRDQIWFSEKDRQGATHLYSLAEYKVRNDASFERDYIQGRYGAIPYLGDLRQIVEGA
ncbi:MAG: ATP-binding protein [Chloroflexi bacterium]|nr:ATP-binding protein [Chloroflexota bacterium]